MIDNGVHRIQPQPVEVKLVRASKWRFRSGNRAHPRHVPHPHWAARRTPALPVGLDRRIGRQVISLRVRNGYRPRRETPSARVYAPRRPALSDRPGARSWHRAHRAPPRHNGRSRRENHAPASAPAPSLPVPPDGRAFQSLPGMSRPGKGADMDFIDDGLFPRLPQPLAIAPCKRIRIDDFAGPMHVLGQISRRRIRAPPCHPPARSCSGSRRRIARSARTSPAISVASAGPPHRPAAASPARNKASRTGIASLLQ